MTPGNNQAALPGLVPASVIASYLREQGWSEHRLSSGAASEWRIATPEGVLVEVLVPLSEDAPDAPTRLSQALDTLSETYGRSLTDLAADMFNIRSDVIRLRAPSDAPDGTVSFHTGHELVDGMYGMLLAAASSTVEPRPYWPSRKPTRAMDYLSDLRLGQTEKGSYVFTVLSKIPEVIADAQVLEVSVDRPDPFERRVAVTLARGLTALHGAVADWQRSRNVRVFSSTVQEGVSANLCDALVVLTEGAGIASVEIGVEWSRVLPTPQLDPPRPFTVEDVPAIEAASDFFKEESAQLGVTISGHVVRLSRGDPSEEGDVTIETRLGGRRAKVHLGLSATRYQDAIRAHESDGIYSATGDLVKEKGRWRLYPVGSMEADTDSADRRDQS